MLAVDHFRDSVEACYGIFDGDRNEEVPRLLQCTMGDVLCEELQHSSVDTVFMCNTFLTSHRWVYVYFKSETYMLHAGRRQLFTFSASDSIFFFLHLYGQETGYGWTETGSLCLAVLHSP